MVMLGDLLASARNSAGGFHAWLKVEDPALAAQVEHAAAGENCSASSYVRGAVSDFARFAAEEDWATLTSSMRDSPEPGTVCLLAMVHWRLTAKACHAHSHHHHQPGASDETTAQHTA